MKQNLIINSVELKVSKQGRNYKSFNTSMGKMSCFENREIENLEKNVGKTIEVEIEERNGFKNITKFFGVKESENIQKYVPNNQEKRVSFVISYTKDLVIGGKVEIIELENTAKRLMKLWDELENMEKPAVKVEFDPDDFYKDPKNEPI